MNIKPISFREKVLYNLIVHGTLTLTELIILSGNRHAWTIISWLNIDKGIKIKTQHIATYTYYTLEDYQKAVDLYQNMMEKRFQQKQDHIEIYKLYKEFPDLHLRDLSKILNINYSRVQYAMSLYFKGENQFV